MNIQLNKCLKRMSNEVKEVYILDVLVSEKNYKIWKPDSSCVKGFIEPRLFIQTVTILSFSVNLV